MFHKVESVTADSNYYLVVRFTNGETKRYDVSQMFEIFPVFSDLTEPGMFEKVKVDAGGYGISWNDEIDIACDELYFGGE